MKAEVSSRLGVIEMSDEVPDWSEGEHLTGDAYVKWIRELRGEL